MNFVNYGTDKMILKSLLTDNMYVLDALLKAVGTDRDILAGEEVTAPGSGFRKVENNDRDDFSMHQRHPSTRVQKTSPADSHGKMVVLRAVSRFRDGREEYYLTHVYVNASEIEKGDVLLSSNVRLPANIRNKLGLHKLPNHVKHKLGEQISKTGRLNITNEHIEDIVPYSVDIPVGESPTNKRRRQNRWLRELGFRAALVGKTLSFKLTNTNTTKHITIDNFTDHFLDRLDDRDGWNKLSYIVSILEHPLVVGKGVTSKAVFVPKKDENNENIPALDANGNQKTNEHGELLWEGYIEKWERYDRTYRFSSLFHSTMLAIDPPHELITFQANSFAVQQAIKNNFFGHTVNLNGVERMEKEEQFNDAFELDIQDEVEKTVKNMYGTNMTRERFDELKDQIMRARHKANPANWETFDPEFNFYRRWDNLNHDNLRSLFDIEAAIKRGFLKELNITDPASLANFKFDYHKVRKFNEEFLTKITTKYYFDSGEVIVDPDRLSPADRQRLKSYAVEYNPDIDPANFDIPLNEVLNGFDPLGFDATQYQQLKREDIATKPEHDALNLELIKNKRGYLIERTVFHPSLVARISTPMTEEQTTRISNQTRRIQNIATNDPRRQFQDQEVIGGDSTDYKTPEQYKKELKAANAAKLAENKAAKIAAKIHNESEVAGHVKFKDKKTDHLYKDWLKEQRKYQDEMKQYQEDKKKQEQEQKKKPGTKLVPIPVPKKPDNWKNYLDYRKEEMKDKQKEAEAKAVKKSVPLNILRYFNVKQDLLKLLA